MLNRLVLVAALLAVALPAAAQPPAPAAGAVAAPTPAVKAARHAARRACAADTATLCKGVQPGGGRIMKCLRAHHANLSQGCKTAFENLRAARQASTQ